MTRLNFFLGAILIIGIFTRIDMMAQKISPPDLGKSFKLIETFDLLDEELSQTTFTETNKLFITSKNRKTNQWIYRLGDMRREISPCNNSSNKEKFFLGGAISDENFFVNFCPDFSFEVWNLNTAKKLLSFQAKKDKTRDFILPYVSRDGERIIFKSSLLSEEVELWNAKSGMKEATLTSFFVDCLYCNRSVYQSVFSPDSKKIAVSFGGIVIVYDAKTGEILHSLKDEKAHLYSSDALSHKSVVSQILFSHDSRMLFTGSYDGFTKAWDAETGDLLQIFKSHEDRVIALALSPDGKTLATGSRDDHFKLWDVRTGKELLKSKDNRNTVKILSFSPDGKKILSTTNYEVYMWELATGNLLEHLRSPDELSVRFSPDWRYVFVKNKNKMLNTYEYTGR